MTSALGLELGIRSMAYVAAESVPFFWPMRAFIHHNPLHGLEHLPFDDAVKKGSKLFHAHSYLSRKAYQEYMQLGQVSLNSLSSNIQQFVQKQSLETSIDLVPWLLREMCEQQSATVLPLSLATSRHVYQALQENLQQSDVIIDIDRLRIQLHQSLIEDSLLFEAIDQLYNTKIGDELDDAVIHACLDFFDEGQSVWSMPNREQGFFHSWLSVAGSHVHQSLKKLLGKNHTHSHLKPERIITMILSEFKIPDDDWVATISKEFNRLHGWSGFIRWRSNTPEYYWQQQYPGDLIDYLAVRLLLQYSLIGKYKNQGLPQNLDDLKHLIDNDPKEVYLRAQLHSDDLLIDMANQVEEVILCKKLRKIEKTFKQYYQKKTFAEAHAMATRLRAIATNLNNDQELLKLDVNQFDEFFQVLLNFHQVEGMLWLRSMESQAGEQLLKGLNLQIEPEREKRPFAKALFCIDTRSERIRRQLESIGDYETYGIAGFFGVPVSFMELGKGSENHLCPVLLTPKNLVIEMTSEIAQNIAAISTLDHAVHDLKESVLTPFVTVEAIGLLFGFDMVGKTLMPTTYNQWRKKLNTKKPETHLMLDKLSREQADSILRAVQRAVIMKAVSIEFSVELERVLDSMVKELREAALGKRQDCPEFAAELNLTNAEVTEFIQRLQSDYRINTKFMQFQMERLGRIGFSLDEQVRFVSVALQSIGLNKDFSRFILMIGHGSVSENNPYESALDCGACGGSHGLISARIISQMANNTAVRKRLKLQGIDIPDDSHFLPANHNTTTDEITLHDLAQLPPSHLFYIDRLREGLTSAARLCAQERLPTLLCDNQKLGPAQAFKAGTRNSQDWSQVRPEWGLSRNAFFVIGKRFLTQGTSLDGRAFLHSYDYKLDPKNRLLENIITGPLVVAQWINMEHYFSTVDNERFGSGSKVYHNVAGKFGVMTGNYSDLRTGLPSQTVLKDGKPYHQPMRLITLIESPFQKAFEAIDAVASVKRLVRNEWIRLMILDPETLILSIYQDGDWMQQDLNKNNEVPTGQERANA